ncbi:Fumarate hydratase class II [Clostridium sp. C105KSO15]|nr:Fumarate hydratase class II [Clostridium sp. C105KSO15]
MFFIVTRRPPRSTQSRSSAASDVYKRQCQEILDGRLHEQFRVDVIQGGAGTSSNMNANEVIANPVSYTHLRAHETRHDLVCRLLLEKKKNNNS